MSCDPQVTMDVLVDMGREELKEIGVNTYGARHKIVKKIKELTTKGSVLVGKSLIAINAHHM